MSKISLIIKREYTTRVAKKSFILLTFLTPLLFVAMIALVAYLSTLKDDKTKTIMLVDETGLYQNVFKSNATYIFLPSSLPVDSLKARQKADNFAAVLNIKTDLRGDSAVVAMYSEQQIGLEVQSYISGLLNNYIENQKIDAYNIPNLKEMVENAKTNIDIKTIKWSKDGGEKESSAELALGIGIGLGILLFMFINLYGAQVMTGVVTEKTNRIVEVLVSSVKPFELMMGKIIGIALVGLTQFFLWVALTGGIMLIAIPLIAKGMDVQQLLSGFQQTADMAQNIQPSELQSFMTILQGIDFVQIITLFVIYFLGGYLLYASLFAAVGSAVDNETDSNQFMMPIMIPLMFAYFAGITAAQNPDGP
ncbi:MAG: ABC transporter permease, partial [Paludibacter sp.]|nr:ABC transporter permease [Paludibacter sp.]